MEKIKITDNCELLFVKNDRFKTTRMTLNFFLPLTEEGYSELAILPFFLTSCNSEYKTPELLNRRLNELYGAVISGTTEKVGDNRRVGFSVSALNDRYSIDGSKPMIDAYKLLCSTVFSPSIGEDGLFCTQDIDREKRLFCENIQAEKNDKRAWARSRCEGEVFKGSPYGQPDLGTLDGAEAITREGVFAAWQRLVERGVLSAVVVGESIPDGFVDHLKSCLGKIERCPEELIRSSAQPADGELYEVTDREDISQGKLVIGVKIGAMSSPKDRAALAVANDLLGGGTYSKFFTVVREQLHLCYYCSSRVERRKGIMYIESGVEAENAYKAKDAILQQLESMKKGEFSDKDINSSKMTLTNSVRTCEDTASVIDRWYSAAELEDYLLTPEEYRRLICEVTREDVAAAAAAFSPRIVYYLLPKEENR